MASEMLLPVYESFVFVWTLEFGNHFCGSFGIVVLCESLYKLELSTLPYVSTTLTINTTSNSKCLRLNEKSFTL